MATELYYDAQRKGYVVNQLNGWSWLFKDLLLAVHFFKGLIR